MVFLTLRFFSFCFAFLYPYFFFAVCFAVFDVCFLHFRLSDGGERDRERVRETDTLCPRVCVRCDRARLQGVLLGAYLIMLNVLLVAPLIMCLVSVMLHVLCVCVFLVFPRTMIPFPGPDSKKVV